MSSPTGKNCGPTNHDPPQIRRTDKLNNGVTLGCLLYAVIYVSVAIFFLAYPHNNSGSGSKPLDKPRQPITEYVDTGGYKSLNPSFDFNVPSASYQFTDIKTSKLGIKQNQKNKKTQKQKSNKKTTKAKPKKISTQEDDVWGLNYTYSGNTKSHVFHSPYCRYYDCKNCRASFSNRRKALNAGYRPCRICNP